ncbi:MAG: hypothetical protein AAF108_06910 [Planctomycetota bacterium]
MSLVAPLAVEVVGRTALVTRASWKGSAGRVERHERLDLGVDPLEDAAAAGRALRTELRTHGLGGGAAIGVLGRGRAIVRWVSLDDGAADLPELPDLIRLEVQASASAVEGDLLVDFVPPAAGETGAMAIGARARDAELLGEVLRAAGLKPRGLTVRPLGLAAMADRGTLGNGFTLVAAIGETGADLAALRHGRLAAARPCVDLGRGLAESVAVEAERLAFASGRERRFASATLVGDPETSRAVAEQIRSSVEGEILTLESPADAAAVGEGADAADAAVHLRLLSLDGAERIDLLRPRESPDPSAAPRRATLLAVAGLTAVFGVGGLVLARDLSKLEDRRDALAGELRSLQGEREQMFRDRARAEHLSRRIRFGDLTPLEELALVHDALPERGPFLLRTLRLARESEVGFSTRTSSSNKKRYEGGSWNLSGEATVAVDARTANRAVVAAGRATLLEQGVYGVRPRGADVEDRVEVVLDRDLFAPLPSADSTPTGAEAGDDGGEP